MSHVDCFYDSFWRISWPLFSIHKKSKRFYGIPLLSFFYHTFTFCSNPLVELDGVCVPCRWDIKCHKNWIGMWEERNLLNCRFRWIERTIEIVNYTKYCMINWHLDTWNAYTTTHSEQTTKAFIINLQCVLLISSKLTPSWETRC